jgi:CBS domain-containing protein
LTIGALGRTAGTVLTSSGFASDLGLCAVSGAAAVTVGILRTSPIAAAVILLEVTGKFSHAVPVLVGALSAHAVAAFISQGIYETMIAQMKLSFLGDGYVESSSLSRLRCARDVMTPHPVVLSATTSASDIEALLIDYSFSIFPVGMPLIVYLPLFCLLSIHSLCCCWRIVDEGYRFLGSIRREVLREQLGQFKAHCDNEAAPDDEE